MLNLNKTAVAVLLALGSSAVSAGTMGPVCTPGNVTVPCEACGWDLGITALYLNPVYDANFGYANQTFDTTTGTSVFHEYNRRWQWAFNLEGSYHFQTGNDVNVNWYHLDSNRNNFNGTFPFFVVGAPVGIPNTNFGRQSRWDAVNAEFGQYVRYSCHKSMRFHGGVQWGSIRTEDHFGLPSFALPVIGAVVLPTSVDTFSRYEFRGFGPRTGIQYQYAFSDCGIHIGANAATAILVGTSKFYNHSTVFLDAFPVSSGSKNAIVPELEASLDVGYNWTMGTCSVGVDVGYLWFNYFHALHNTDRRLDIAPYGLQTDFGATGPYVRLKATTADYTHQS